jgi:hypothetical protein
MKIIKNAMPTEYQNLKGVRAMFRRTVIICLGTLIVIAMTAMVHAPSLLAATRTFNVSEGDWSTGSSWLGGTEPSGIDLVYVNNNGTADITQSGEVASYLYLGQNSNQTGTVNMTSGALSVTNYEYIAYSGKGTFIQSGGTNTAGTITVGMGFNSKGTYTQSGGTTRATGGHIYIAYNDSSSGTYNLFGTGYLDMNSAQLDVGYNGTGVFNQSGGTVQASTIVLGYDGFGTYNFTGDQLTGGSLTLKSTGSVMANGTFQGYGTVGMTGILNNNDKVIANGYGTEQTLDLSSFSEIRNTGDNANGTAGWFAQNKGKLTLPSIALPTMGAVNWGELLLDPEVELVNSIHFIDYSLDTGGSLSASLLATDRSEVTDIKGSANLIGFWDISAPDVIFGSGYTEMIFRYDDALASQLGITETDLKLGHYVNGKWYDVTTSIDTANNYITANNITSFSPFAIGSGFTFTIEAFWNSSSGNWSEASNWDPNGTPSSSTDVYVENSGTANIDSSSDAKIVTIGAGAININSGGTLNAESIVNGTGTGTINIDGGTLVLSNNDIDIDNFNVGYAASTTGTFTLASGKTLTTTSENIGNSGTGTFTQTGGTNTTGEFCVAYDAGSSGTYNLSGGVLSASTQYPYVGYSGNGTFTQTGGTAKLRTLAIGSQSGSNGVYTESDGITILNTLYLGSANGSSGTYNLQGGVLSVFNSEIIGQSGKGSFVQSGGTNQVTNGLYVGVYGGAVGSYDLQGGRLDVDSTEYIGGFGGTGTFTQSGGTNTAPTQVIIGNSSSSSGTYTMTGGALLGGSMIVRNNADATATFQGQGTVYMTGTLTNNGKVIADGGTLDMSGFASVTNTIENTTTNGWYATNQGKLILPSISVAAGDNIYNWGEASGDTTLDLVNSLRLSFTGVTTPGSLMISLLAADNPDMPSVGSGIAMNMWDFAAPSLEFGSVDITFMYDDTLLSSLGILPANLTVYHYASDNMWHKFTTTSIDEVNKLVTITGASSFTGFALGDPNFSDQGDPEPLGDPIPEPATVASIIGGLFMAALRRVKGPGARVQKSS